VTGLRQAAYRFINIHLKGDPSTVTDSEQDLIEEQDDRIIGPITHEMLSVFEGELPGDALNPEIDEHFVPMADRPATRTIGDHLSGLGQPMWRWATPDGFPDSREFWVTTNTTLRRWELAGRFGNRTLNGFTIDTAALLPSPMPATIDLVIRALAARFGIPITQTDVAAVTEFLGVTTDTPVADVRLTENLGDVIGLLLSFPANQYR